MLIAELNHRVRNILSLIRGLIRQSKPKPGTSLEEFVAMIDGRVHALARAHNQITDKHWGPAALRLLIDTELAAYLKTPTDKVVAEGAAILLNPQAYSTVALVVHELVTNSAKYGALKGDGAVDLRWSRDAQSDLVIEWREHGGPAVSPPTRKGFGTTIIEHSVPYDLGGSATIEYRPDGVHARFVIPGKHVTEVAEVKGRTTDVAAIAPDSGDPSAHRDLLGGKRVILVEDSLIIALDAEDILRQLGAKDVVTDGTVPGAIAAIEAERPDVAILDINLGDYNSFPVADLLDDAGVPFMFATGYGEQTQFPVRHRARIVMRKPYTLQMMARVLSELIGQQPVAD